VKVCIGPKDANGNLGQGLSPRKIKFYASLQEATDRNLVRRKHPLKISTIRPSLPSRLAATTNKIPT